MLQHYFRIAFRHLLKHKAYTLINIAGLSTGIACCLLIFLFVHDELSYDRYHRDADRIHRVVKDFVNDDGSTLPDATTPAALGPAIAAEIPEAESVVRIFPGWSGRYMVKNGEVKFYEQQLYRVDSNIFQVFDFEFVAGNPETALNEISSVVITEAMAEKYFGKEAPLGRVLNVQGRGDVKVTAVVRNVPRQSHFHFDFLVPNRPGIDQYWQWYNFYTYVKLRKGADPAAFDRKVQQLYQAHVEDGKNRFYSQPLTDIHLKSNLKWEIEPNGDILQVYVFITIAIFVVIIASINYVNLSTAQSARRGKEVGIRKVSGAFRSALMMQFLAESVLITLGALIIGFGLLEVILPFFNGFIGRELDLFMVSNAPFIFYVILAAVALGVLSGLYPALFLSSFEPVKVLKGAMSKAGGYGWLRKGLVVLQFTISIVLITGTVIVSRQIEFISDFKLGFNKEQVMVLPNSGTFANRQKFINELKQQQHVAGVGSSSSLMGGLNSTTIIGKEGTKDEMLVNYSFIDYDFIPTMGIELAAGRNFSKDYGSDYLQGIILNETAAKQMGFDQPLGSKVVWEREEDTIIYRTVVGVVKDFNFASLHNEIKPYAFIMDDSALSVYNIRLKTADLSTAIAAVASTWQKTEPELPFEYFFLDQTFENLHKSERNFRTVFTCITGLAIFIACLGLFSLTAYTLEQRTKEIGIRKVLGATVSGITGMLTADFMKLVLLANVLAWPLAYWAMNSWLQHFAFRISIGWGSFLLATLSALGIALFTISFQTVRAALANPVDALRSE